MAACLKIRQYLLILLLISWTIKSFADSNELKEYFAYFTLPSTILTFAPFIMTNQASQNKSNSDEKIVINAKSDAYLYIASNGDYHTAHLEEALNILRNKYPNISDMELVNTIIYY